MLLISLEQNYLRSAVFDFDDDADLIFDDDADLIVILFVSAFIFLVTFPVRNLVNGLLSCGFISKTD